MPVKEVRQLGWTRKSAGVSVLLAMEEHRRQAGARVLQLREAKRWTHEDLAHAAGLSVKTVSRFEKGRNEGRRTTIRKLAQALNVDEADIIGAPPAPLGLGVVQADDAGSDAAAALRQLVERQEAVEQALVALTQRASDPSPARAAKASASILNVGRSGANRSALLRAVVSASSMSRSLPVPAQSTSMWSAWEFQSRNPAIPATGPANATCTRRPRSYALALSI